MKIATNSTAFNIWTNYTKNNAKLQSSMSKLSSGYISNTDDPAGIGISERMKSQEKSTEMASSNAENAVSLLQTADSWLQTVNDELSRMKALAVENEGITSDSDKENIQTEFKSLQQEVTRITSKYTSAAKFNGLYLFRGGTGVAVITGDSVKTGQLSVQIGADVDQTIDINLSNLAVTNTAVIGTVSTYSYGTDGTTVLGSSHTNVTWSSIIDTSKMSVGTTNAVAMLESAINFVSNARASMGAQQSRLENTYDGLITYADNLSSAESNIRDVDMARETTLLSTYQVLTSAATSVLAQANQLGSGVTQLLQG